MEVKVVNTNIYTAKVNDIYNHDSVLYLTQGVKRNQQSRFEKSIEGRGSHGSYLMIDGKLTYTFVKLYVYDLQKTIIIDIREFLKEKYTGQRLTKRFLIKVRANMPKKIKVQCTNNIWEIVNYDSLQFKTLN